MVLGAWKRSGLPLKIREDPVTTFGPQFVELSVEEVAVNHGISCRWLVLATTFPTPALSNGRSRFPLRTPVRPRPVLGHANELLPQARCQSGKTIWRQPLRSNFFQ